MTSRPKILSLVAFAVLAAIALSAPGAQAKNSITKPAEPIWLTTTPDGTATTAHHVFDNAGASITCPGMTGHATISGVGTSFTTFSLTNVVYTGVCKYVGQTATTNMNGCNYHFEITPTPVNKIHFGIKGCNAGGQIEFSVPSPACKVTTPEQSGLSSATVHNPNANEVTVELHVTGITYTATGAGCPTAGTFSNGNYTTGNFLLTAENHAGVMKPIQAQ